MSGMSGWAAFFAAVTTAALVSAPSTQPAGEVDRLRERAADLERREAADLRALVRLADAARDTPALRWAYRRLEHLGRAEPAERLRLALLLYQADLLDEARRRLGELLRTRPGDLRATYLSAAVEERAGRSAESRRLLQHASRILPARKRPHLETGDFLAGAGLLDYAGIEWRRVLEVRSEAPSAADLEARVRLGALARRKERFGEAVSHYRAALKLLETADIPASPTTEWLTVELAMSLRDAGQADEARRYLPAVEAYYRERIRRDPADADARNALGWFYAGLGRKLDEGIKLLEEALAAEPRRPEYLDTLAELFLRKGRLRRALELIDRALAARPPNPEYYRRRREEVLRMIGGSGKGEGDRP